MNNITDEVEKYDVGEHNSFVKKLIELNKLETKTSETNVEICYVEHMLSSGLRPEQEFTYVKWLDAVELSVGKIEKIGGVQVPRLVTTSYSNQIPICRVIGLSGSTLFEGETFEGQTFANLCISGKEKEDFYYLFKQPPLMHKRLKFEGQNFEKLFLTGDEEEIFYFLYERPPPESFKYNGRTADIDSKEKFEIFWNECKSNPSTFLTSPKKPRVVDSDED